MVAPRIIQAIVVQMKMKTRAVIWRNNCSSLASRSRQGRSKHESEKIRQQAKKLREKESPRRVCWKTRSYQHEHVLARHVSSVRARSDPSAGGLSWPDAVGIRARPCGT